MTLTADSRPAQAVTRLDQVVRRRVLVIIQGELGENLAGPQIRGLEIARSFAARHQVTVAASVPGRTTRDGIPVVPRSRASLLSEVRSHEVVVAPLLPPYLLSALAGRASVRVADLYDPVDLEVGTLGTARAARRALRRQQALRKLQLRWSDVVVCANDRQRDRALADLRRLRRSDHGPALVTVPMGLPHPPARSVDHPIRRRFGIPDDHPVVLWWGTVWRWLDAGTAIRAIKILAERRPDVRLVITSGRPADRRTDLLNATEEARNIARELGVLDRNVFFFDSWVPYEERHVYLADADLGLTLHAGGPESPLAARARYMDFIWASLPSVLAEGDELAADMAASGAAWLVPPRDPQATARAIERMVSDPNGLAHARQACTEMAHHHGWPAIIEPLVRLVEATAPATYSARKSFGVARESGGFYVQRCVDACLAARA